MKRLLIAALLALPFYASAGEEKNVKTENETVFQGTIADVNNNYKPLSDVELTVIAANADLTKKVKTDKEGKFIVKDLPAGSYKVRFEKQGYEPGSYSNLTVKEGTSNNFGFVLFEN